MFQTKYISHHSQLHDCLTIWGMTKYFFVCLREITAPALQKLYLFTLRISSAVSQNKYTRWLCFRNLMITNTQLKNAEMPRVHASGFPETHGLKRNYFLIGHRWLPYFSEHTGHIECIRVQSKSPIKTNRSKKPSNRVILRKGWRGEIFTNTFDFGNSG